MKELPHFSMLMRIAWRNYTRRFDVILYANLAALLPINIALDLTSPRHLYATELSNPADPLTLLTQITSLFADPLYVTNVLLQIVATFFMMYVVTAIVVSMKRVYDRQPIIVPEVLQESLRFFPRVLVVTILTKLIIGLGFIAFIIPGIIASLLLSFTIPALVWHNLTPWQAMVRSYRAVRQNWWNVLYYLLLVNLMVTAVILVTIIFIPDMPGFKTFSLTIANIITSYIPLFATVLFAALDLDLSEDSTKDKSVTTPA